MIASVVGIFHRQEPSHRQPPQGIVMVTPGLLWSVVAHTSYGRYLIDNRLSIDKGAETGF
jgi:hypothetical protein